MSERDKYDEMAGKLLPNFGGDWPIDKARSRVAVKLRRDGELLESARAVAKQRRVEIADLESVLNKKQNMFDTVLGDREALRAEIARLEADISDLSNARVIAFECEVNALNAENEKLKAAIDQMAEQLGYPIPQSGHFDLDTICGKIVCGLCGPRQTRVKELEAEAENEKLKAEVARLIDANEHWHLRVESLKTEVERYPAKLEAEAERVTERDCKAIYDALGAKIDWVEAVEPIRAAQRREAEGK